MLTWDFLVRHYANDVSQRRDRKYDKRTDLSAGSGEGAQGGVHYPRRSALGGCTAHHAMIVMKPPAGDWDESRASRATTPGVRSDMKGYFTTH